MLQIEDLYEKYDPESEISSDDSFLHDSWNTSGRTHKTESSTLQCDSDLKLKLNMCPLDKQKSPIKGKTLQIIWTENNICEEPDENVTDDLGKLVVDSLLYISDILSNSDDIKDSVDKHIVELSRKEKSSILEMLTTLRTKFSDSASSQSQDLTNSSLESSLSGLSLHSDLCTSDFTDFHNGEMRTSQLCLSPVSNNTSLEYSDSQISGLSLSLSDLTIDDKNNSDCSLIEKDNDVNSVGSNIDGAMGISELDSSLDEPLTLEDLS